MKTDLAHVIRCKFCFVLFQCLEMHRDALADLTKHPLISVAARSKRLSVRSSFTLRSSTEHVFAKNHGGSGAGVGDLMACPVSVRISFLALFFSKV
jgi:hypothetical protein